MSRGRPPFSALLAALMLCAVPASAQLSPGKLSRFHGSLEGSTSCGKCHDRREGVAPEKCLACHGALGARISAGQGLHARPRYGDCKSCHVEHQGTRFEIVWWGEAGREAFDHREAGYVLEPLPTTCSGCHGPAGRPQQVAGR